MPGTSPEPSDQHTFTTPILFLLAYISFSVAHQRTGWQVRRHHMVSLLVTPPLCLCPPLISPARTSLSCVHLHLSAQSRSCPPDLLARYLSRLLARIRPFALAQTSLAWLTYDFLLRCYRSTSPNTHEIGRSALSHMHSRLCTIGSSSSRPTT